MGSREEVALRKLLLGLCDQYKVKAIAEELNTETLAQSGSDESVPMRVAKATKLPHCFCDPNTEERKRLIRQVLDRLSGTDQTVLRKVFLEDRDKDDICRELGIDRDYLRVRVHRALARFRGALEKETGLKSFATAVS